MSEGDGGCAVVPLGDRYREWAAELIAARWGSTAVVTRGRVHDTGRLGGFVAVSGGEPVGLATYRIAGGECEMVSLDSLRERLGIGTALVEAVAAAGRASGCRRLWLITTNDNLAAVRFYQNRGFHIAAVHLDALYESRRLKPEIPLNGLDGIPLRDEIELELSLC
jgi:ribosomal protein S18 acetylase RimI-like enzyme